MLSYHCGSAREFFYPDGSQSVSQSMRCHWDRQWRPGTELGECDWVACLKPAPPPPSTHLVVTGWHGDPTPFGDTIQYVCDKGHYFQEGGVVGFHYKQDHQVL